jgi:hypothetical protein
MDTFGTWNVRSLYGAGTLDLVTSKIDKYRMDLVRSKGSQVGR